MIDWQVFFTFIAGFIILYMLYYYTVWFFWCPYCNKFHLQRPKRRRMCTKYCDDEMNYMTSCLPEFEEINGYWEERWQEYWSSVL